MYVLYCIQEVMHVRFSRVTFACWVVGNWGNFFSQIFRKCRTVVDVGATAVSSASFATPLVSNDLVYLVPGLLWLACVFSKLEPVISLGSADWVSEFLGKLLELEFVVFWSVGEILCSSAISSLTESMACSRPPPCLFIIGEQSTCIILSNLNLLAKISGDGDNCCLRRELKKIFQSYICESGLVGFPGHGADSCPD